MNFNKKKLQTESNRALFVGLIAAGLSFWNPYFLFGVCCFFTVSIAMTSLSRCVDEDEG